MPPHACAFFNQKQMLQNRTLSLLETNTVLGDPQGSLVMLHAGSSTPKKGAGEMMKAKALAAAGVRTLTPTPTPTIIALADPIHLPANTCLPSQLATVGYYQHSQL